MDWETNVNTYLHIVEAGFPEALRPEACLRCQKTGFQQRHACFTRNLYTLTDLISLVIYRFLCPMCKKTYSVLPAFLRPHHVIATDVQEQVLRDIDQGSTVERAAVDICPGVTVDPKTVRRWKNFWGNLLEICEEPLTKEILAVAPHITLPVGEKQRNVSQTKLRWLSYLWSKLTCAEETKQLLGLLSKLRQFSLSVTAELEKPTKPVPVRESTLSVR